MVVLLSITLKDKHRHKHLRTISTSLSLSTIRLGCGKCGSLFVFSSIEPAGAHEASLRLAKWSAPGVPRREVAYLDRYGLAAVCTLGSMADDRVVGDKAVERRDAVKDEPEPKERDYPVDEKTSESHQSLESNYR
jgi:hypothetical protein